MTATMATFRLTAWGAPGEYAEVPVPTPGPGQVLVRMAAVGLCHSDVLLLDGRAGPRPFEPPFTLGHENAGFVAELGAGVASIDVGDGVLVAGVDSCGRCDDCVAGRDNYCWQPRRMRTRGVGDDGGLARYLVAPERQLVPLLGHDVVLAAPLADAGATAYRAVRDGLDAREPASSVVVIGVGGLGGFAIQFLKLLSPARVIAIDRIGAELNRARRLGADESVLVSAADRPNAVSDRAPQADEIVELARGAGADSVLDFVGTDASLRLALDVVAPRGRVVVVGKGPGTVTFGWNRCAPGATVSLSLGSTLSDLRQVVALARAGHVNVETQVFGFDQIPAAYSLLRAGEIRGRAVVVLDA